MSKANQLTSMPLRLIANQCLGKMGATIANTTASKVDALTAVNVTIGGVMSAVAAQDELVMTALAASDLPTALTNWVQPTGRTGFYTQPANTTVYYVFGWNGTAMKVVQGSFDPAAAQNTTLDPMQVGPLGGMLTPYALGKSVIPDVPDGFTPCFVMKVVTGGAAFVPGTTALTGIATFKDVGVLPVDGTF